MIEGVVVKPDPDDAIVQDPDVSTGAAGDAAVADEFEPEDVLADVGMQIVAQPDVAIIPADAVMVIESEKGDKGAKGDKGDPGDPGTPGSDVSTNDGFF